MTPYDTPFAGRTYYPHAWCSFNKFYYININKHVYSFFFIAMENYPIWFMIAFMQAIACINRQKYAWFLYAIAPVIFLINYKCEA